MGYAFKNRRTSGTSYREGTIWHDQASCKGLPLEMFFRAEEGKSTGPVSGPRAVMCYDCPVKLECRLAGYAEDHGDWGNTSPSEREKYRSAIFQNSVPYPLASREDTERARFREWIYEVLRKGGDVLQNLRDQGLGEYEISLFASRSPMDIRAMKTIKRQYEARLSELRAKRIPKEYVYEDPQG